jgi:hypothetical protein
VPAACVTLDGARHDEPIISTEHAEQIAEQIRTGAAHGPRRPSALRAALIKPSNQQR